MVTTLIHIQRLPKLDLYNVSEIGEAAFKAFVWFKFNAAAFKTLFLKKTLIEPGICH